MSSLWREKKETLRMPERRCPYCGCGFVPSAPEQIYCSLFCQVQHREALADGYLTQEEEGR